MYRVKKLRSLFPPLLVFMLTISYFQEDAATCEVKVDETEEDFKTPEEGDGEENPEEGDGEENSEEGGGEDVTDEVKLDDDQDIESPAYIPKTGQYVVIFTLWFYFSVGSHGNRVGVLNVRINSGKQHGRPNQ